MHQCKFRSVRMRRRSIGIVFVWAFLQIAVPAFALDDSDADRAESGVLRASVLAQWNILEAMAVSSSAGYRAAYCGKFDYICMGPDKGHIALELIAAGNSPQKLSILAQLFRYRNPQFLEMLRCHALGKGDAIRPYLESLRPGGMNEECVRDVQKYIRPTGIFPVVDSSDICATAPEIKDRVTKVLDEINRDTPCGMNDPVPMAEEAFLYGMVMLRTPAWREYCRTSQSPCDGVGLPQWELALSLIETLDTPDALASLARLYRFSSDAALSEEMGCAVGMKGGKIWPYIREIEASDLRRQCEQEITELRRQHPGRFDAVNTDWVCRPFGEIEARTKYHRENNPPTAVPEAMYEICY